MWSVSIVSQEEYNLADEFTKRIINYIDASILALNVLDTDVEAILSVSKNKNNNFSNNIVICRSENDLSVPQEVYRVSCTVCGLRSAYSCLKKMQEDNSLSDEFDVHVKRVGDCVQISW